MALPSWNLYVVDRGAVKSTRKGEGRREEGGGEGGREREEGKEEEGRRGREECVDCNQQ